MKHKATYLLIKSSVLSVTDQQKPVYSDFSANSALDFSYEEKLEAFNESFIKVDNPEAFWNQADLPSALRVKMNMREREDGLYPAPDGIEFEVSTISLSGNGWSAEERVAVVSLIGDKEEKPEKEKEIKLGEIFLVEGKPYVFTKPETGTQTPNTTHGHILHEIETLFLNP